MKKQQILILAFLLTPLFITSMEDKPKEMDLGTELEQTALTNSRKHTRDEKDNSEDDKGDYKRIKYEQDQTAESTKNKTEETEWGWSTLPIEIQDMILFKLGQSMNKVIAEDDALQYNDNEEDEYDDSEDKLIDVFQTYASVSLVNKQFNKVATDVNCFDIPTLIYKLRNIFEVKVNAAARTNDLHTLKTLLKKGLIVRNFDRAITVASRNKHIEFCKELILAGALEGVRNPKLINAIYLHDFETVKNQIKLSKYNPHESNGSIERNYPYDEIPAFIIAAEIGDFEILKLFLESDADITWECKNERTALMIACSNGDRDIVELLLNFEADVNQRNKSGLTALSYANQEIFTLLRQKGAQPIAQPQMRHVLIEDSLAKLKENQNSQN